MKYSLGAEESSVDLRDFAFNPTIIGKLKVLASDLVAWFGGKRYNPEDIESQERVGICTAIWLTQMAKKATGVKYNADFQYYLQKRFIDLNWNEGSSFRTSLKAGNKYGLLPEKYWKYKISRNQPYSKYIKELQNIPEKEIQKLLKKCVKIQGYQSVPLTRDALAQAINQSEAGIGVRFVVGDEWWTAPVEPLRPPKQPISGHAIIVSNYTGGSFRVANTWGSDWADKGTAYFLLKDYRPTEAWLVHFKKTTKGFDKTKKNSLT